MSITEMELANTLYERHTSDHQPLDWVAVARHAAELLGVTLTPEKPEPGTWHLTEDGPAYVDETGSLYTSSGRLDDWFIYYPDECWPTLTPARVVPAEPVELSEAEVGELWDAHISNDDWGTWGTLGREFARIYATLVNAALAKHGHGRVEVSREQVENSAFDVLLESENDGDRRGMPDVVRDRIKREASLVTDAVMELLGGGDRG